MCLQHLLIFLGHYTTLATFILFQRHSGVTKLKLKEAFLGTILPDKVKTLNVKRRASLVLIFS